jgi:ferredoxin-NADP reductase
MMRLVDRFLDHITMYRLALYYLVALAVAALLLSAAGFIPHGAVAIGFSGAVTLAACFVTNWLFALVFAVPANGESIYITALILILIVDPVAPADLKGAGGLVFASIWAISSKYILAIGGKHLFNPAALGAVLAGLLIDRPATWWVAGNLPLLPVVLVGGLLLVRKLRRFDLVAIFIVANLAAVLAGAAPAQYATALNEALLSSPLFFFAFVMLTEPLTAPTTRVPRLIFGALVGILCAPEIHIGTFYFTPELALVVGNLFAYATGPRGRLVLTLERIEEAAADTYDFVFSSPQRLAFQAGQYLEWTLGLDRPDSRGNRRYFTVASAPTEASIRLGVKFYAASSAFKRALARMAPGDTIYAAQLAGNFTLPARPDRKLVFIAGGIGIMPFRSMLQYLIDREEPRPIVVLYGNQSEEDIAYRDVLDAAERELGIPTVYAVAEGARRGQYPGYIDARLIRHVVPDYRQRIFYISGPQAMVQAVRGKLRRMGVPRSRIKVDFFPGFA